MATLSCDQVHTSHQRSPSRCSWPLWNQQDRSPGGSQTTPQTTVWPPRSFSLLTSLAAIPLIVLALGCGGQTKSAQDQTSDGDRQTDQGKSTAQKRMLPAPVGAETAETKSNAQDATATRQNPEPDNDEGTAPSVSLSDPLTEEERRSPLDDYVTPDQVAAKAFAAPPEATLLSKRSNVWVDRDLGRVYADGYVAIQDGPLEMFACPTGTKEHEAVVASLAPAHELHAALLAIGAQPGTPAEFDPSFVPATGQRIRVWVCYRDHKGKFQVYDARQWVRYEGSEKTLEKDWVFAGSSVWTDPRDNQNYYQADAGDMICVSNFSTAMLDLPVVSSADVDSLAFLSNHQLVPERGTPLRLILEPIPVPSDEVPEPEAPLMPKERVLGPNKPVSPASAS